MQASSADRRATDVCPINHLVHAIISNSNNNFVLLVNMKIRSAYAKQNKQRQQKYLPAGQSLKPEKKKSWKEVRDGEDRQKKTVWVVIIV